MTNPNEHINPINQNTRWYMSDKGLTKREYFAAMALQGLCVQAIAGSHNSDTESFNIEKADHAVNLADALINALNETK
jgi:hypothetical protein